jgi:hypothetical protein
MLFPAPDGGWNVKKGGADRASKHFEIKKDAESLCTKSECKPKILNWLFHKSDGTISKKRLSWE